MLFENYSVVAQLGKHSNVFLLCEISTGSLVVKRIINSSQLETYILLHKLQNPHLPRIFSIRMIENGFYEVYEQYIYGRTLEEILLEEKILKKKRAINYIHQLIEVLDVVHKAGLIHRDIKPSNIIINSQNKLFLIDFDIARFQKRSQTHDTQFLGTQGFAAPEQFGFHQTDVSSDIYSLGILLNVMLTGKFPIEKVYPGDVGKIILRCTEINHKRRYKSVKALWRSLQPYNTRTNLKIIGFIRQLPGFRNFKIWKMLIALIIEAYYALFWYVLYTLYDRLAIATRILDISWAIYFGYVILFLFDSFDLRSGMPWLEESRGRFTYFLNCIFWIIITLVFDISVSAIFAGLFR